MESKIKYKQNSEYRLIDQVRKVLRVTTIHTEPNSLTLAGYRRI